MMTYGVHSMGIDPHKKTGPASHPDYGKEFGVHIGYSKYLYEYTPFVYVNP